MTLEQQLAALAEIGLGPDDGVTAEDFLQAFDRKKYEDRPFNLVLFVLGIEVEQGSRVRPVCSRVWNFDTECIEGTGDYVGIIMRLCRVADQPDAITDVSDFVDLDAGEAWLKYKVRGADRDWPVEVNDDWADTLALSYVMDDLECDGHRFYFVENGQAMVLYYLDARKAADLNRLSNNAVKPVLPW
jgi:hypothetical protein